MQFVILRLVASLWLAGVGATPLQFESVLPGESSAEVGVLHGAVGMEMHDDPPYDPERANNRLVLCRLGAYIFEPYNGVQIQNEGAAVKGQNGGCTFADWVACGARDEASCAGPIPDSGKECLWVDNPPEYQEKFGKGSCVFNCYPAGEVKMGIPLYFNAMLRYDGSYVDLATLSDPIDAFKCLSKSTEGPEVCAQTVDSTGHPCSSCKVPAAFYPFHRPELAEGETTEGLDHWCINTRGFPRFCDFLREPALSCDAVNPQYMYPPDWTGPTYEPPTTQPTSKPTSKPTTRSTRAESTDPVNPATNGQGEVLAVVVAAIAGVASFFF